jgi:hypothetical protein
LALQSWVKVRGGAVNSQDVDDISDLVDEFEQFRQALPRASPGADVSGDTWVNAAILTANAARTEGKMVSLNYIKAILERWRAEGYQAKFGRAPATVNDDGRTVIRVDI